MVALLGLIGAAGGWRTDGVTALSGSSSLPKSKLKTEEARGGDSPASSGVPRWAGLPLGPRVQAAGQEHGEAQHAGGRSRAPVPTLDTVEERRRRELPVCRVLRWLALLFAPEQRSRTLLGARRRRGGTMPEERHEVAVVVQLVNSAPDTDWHDPSHATEAAPTMTRGHMHLVRDLQAHIHLKQEAERAEVVPGEAVRINFHDLAEASESLPDLILIPVLIREVEYMDVGKPGRGAVESVGALVRPLELELHSVMEDWAMPAEHIPGRLVLTTEEHCTTRCGQELNRHEGLHGRERSTEEGIDLCNWEGWVNICEGKTVKNLILSQGEAMPAPCGHSLPRRTLSWRSHRTHHSPPPRSRCRHQRHRCPHC